MNPYESFESFCNLLPLKDSQRFTPLKMNLSVTYLFYSLYSPKDSKTDISRPNFTLPDADSASLSLGRFRQEFSSLLI